MVENHYHNNLDSNQLVLKEAIKGAPQPAIVPFTITYTLNPVSGGDTKTIANGALPTNAELIFCIQSLTNKLDTLISELKTLGVLS